MQISVRSQEKRLVKKLVTVSMTFTLTTETSGKVVILQYIPCIKYPFQFQKNQLNNIQALLDLERKVNAMHPNYAKKLGFPIQKTDVGAQKVDELSLQTFEMIIADFQVLDKLEKTCFFY